MLVRTLRVSSHSSCSSLVRSRQGSQVTTLASISQSVAPLPPISSVEVAMLVSSLIKSGKFAISWSFSASLSVFVNVSDLPFRHISLVRSMVNTTACARLSMPEQNSRYFSALAFVTSVLKFFSSSLYVFYLSGVSPFFALLKSFQMPTFNTPSCRMCCSVVSRVLVAMQLFS